MEPVISTLSSPPSEADFAALCALLRDAVEGGASVGYLVPVREAEMIEFWQDIFAEVARGHRVVLVAREAGRIVGTVQLELAQKPNSRHRAELQKLLVLRSHRGRGLGSALMLAAEAAARRHARSLLVLDTSATGNAMGLYARCGYTKAGAIPRYATDPDGTLIDTVVHYKELAPIAAASPGEVRTHEVRSRLT
jgi:GNAT superfamily N-acetyltransferase